MKSMLFGLALLCALPGCCGMWKCGDKKEKSCKTGCDDKSSRRNGNKSEKMSDKKMTKKDSYK